MKNIPLYEVRKIRSIKELMDTSAELYSDRTAFLYKPKGNDKYVPVTFRQFKADVDALGTALIDIGLKGGRVAIISENRYEWAVSYMAVVNGTGIVVPLDKELPENEIENLLIRSKADAVIFSDNLKNSVLNIAKRIDFIKHYIIMDDAAEKNGSDTSQQTELTELKELIEKGRKKVAEGCRDFIDAEIDTEALSILLFTSATTKEESLDVLTFIGRMVQHILPKGFQRIRYYGLQATKTYEKWSQVIKEGLKNFCKAVQGVYEVIESRNYRQRYKESSGKDPLKCPFCGSEMKVWKIWHPIYGVIYDEEKNIRQGKYEKYSKPRDRGGCTLRGCTRILQISMFSLSL